MEDAARFVLDDAPLTEALKSLRHDLRGSLDLLPSGWLEANRNVRADVGKDISNRHEMQRESLRDIAIAAGKRLTEALRAIEEAAKTIHPDLAQQIEGLRYRAYDIEAQLHARLGTGCARQWRLCLLLTESICRRPWREVLEGAIAGGIDCVQVREKQMDGGELAQRVREVIAIARPRGVAVIVNDRADVALATGADGVHVGVSDLSIQDVRRLAGRTLLVGASTHDLGEANRAVEAGADYCGVGAMFASSLKPDRTPSGVGYLREFLTQHPFTPHLAIGGITIENIDEVTAAGAKGVAVSTAICAADDPREAARRLRERLMRSSAMSASHRAPA